MEHAKVQSIILFRFFHLGLKLVVVQDARMIAALSPSPGNRMIVAAVRNHSGCPCVGVLHKRRTILSFGRRILCRLHWMYRVCRYVRKTFRETPVAFRSVPFTYCFQRLTFGVYSRRRLHVEKRFALFNVFLHLFSNGLCVRFCL